VWSLAAAASASSEGAFTLLWAALAWGSNGRFRENRRRLRCIADQIDVTGDVLVRAADLASSDPRGAYAILRPSRFDLVRYLGPCRFTRYLYFAGGGRPDHPSLILDRRIAGALRHWCGWDTLYTDGLWPAPTYGRYCGLLQRWSTELSSPNRPVAPDELERYLSVIGAGTGQR
jgi:hypothetical protein